MMKLCCGTNLYASHTLETALREISKRGIRAVDLWASPALCSHIDPDRDDPEEVKPLLEKYGLTPVSLTAFLITDKERRSRMNFAKEMGIPTVIWEPAQSVDWGDNMTNLKAGSVPFGSEGGSLKEFLDKLREYIGLAEKLDLKIGMEVPHRYTLNEYLYQIWRTRQAVEDERLCYVIAPPHADARGYTPEQVLDIVGSDRTYMLYLWDIQEQYAFPESDGAFGDGTQQMPGGGKRNFHQLIGYFQKHGFKGWYNISCHGVEAWKDLDKIGACLDRAVKIARRAIEGSES